MRHPRRFAVEIFSLIVFVFAFYLGTRLFSSDGAIWPGNVIRYAISFAIKANVSQETITLLLLLPVVATFIAAVRHIIGIRGFGILLPAALSIVFVAIGPGFGIGLFLVIVFVSTMTRVFLRDAKVRLQYLPRMAFILWAIVVCLLGLIFLTPIIGRVDIANVSIFPVLILVLLSEDFTRVQLGKSAKTAIKITAETLFLGVLSYFLLVTQALRNFAITSPELLLIGVAVSDFLIGKYSGLRLVEYWRFRKLLRS